MHKYTPIILLMVALLCGCSRCDVIKSEESVTIKVRREFIEKHNGMEIIPTYNGRTLFDDLPEGVNKPRKEMSEVEKVEDDISSIAFLIFFPIAVGDTVTQWIDGPTIYLSVSNETAGFVKIISPGFNRQSINSEDLAILKGDKVRIVVVSQGTWNVRYSQEVVIPKWNGHCTIDLNKDGIIEIY